MTKKQEREKEVEEYKVRLREWLPPGSVVYANLCHVSRSGMQREISFHAIVGGEMFYLSGYIAAVLDMRRGKRDGVVVGGCGMDMGFHVVSNLSRVLYPTGFGCIGATEVLGNPTKRCPSNDHSNGDRDYRPHVECPNEGDRKLHDRWHEHAPDCKRPACHWHTSGDYAISCRWL